MTALKAHEITRLLKKRDPRWAAILLYGPDAGAVRERSDILARQIVTDLKDAFNFIELTEAELKEEPSRLVDEAAALSFLGGERVVRVRGSSEKVTSSVKLLLSSLEAETFQPNAITIIEAGSLRKTSGLRKLFEKSPKAAALPCYEATAQDLKTMVQEILAADGLTIDDNALHALLSLLGANSSGSDRGIFRSEVDKLVLYKGPKETRSQDQSHQISLADISACLSEAGQGAATDIPQLVASGQTAALAQALYRANEAGASPISILIFLQRHFIRLYTAQSFIAEGLTASMAMKKLRPPVFFAEERAFQAQLTKWSMGKLENALSNLLTTEHAAKTTGAPQKELVERTALRLTMIAAR